MLTIPGHKGNANENRINRTKIPPHPMECDSGYSRGTCTPMFIAALFTIAKYGNSQSILTNVLRKCGMYTQWNFFSHKEE
jgi:hypothetical protein